MYRRATFVSLVCVALLGAAAGGALAQANSPNWDDLDEFTHANFWPVQDGPASEIKVTQTVAQGVAGTETEGLFKYRWLVVNDTSVGLGSPLDVFEFLEDFDGGPVLDHREGQAWGTWTYTLAHDTLTNAPKWVSDAAGVPVGEQNWFEIVSAGPPDRLYPGRAIDLSSGAFATGETTGPTGEPPNGNGFETGTPGAWGGRPRGNNNASLLHANFGDFYPDGVQVGGQEPWDPLDGAEPWALLFTSALAVQEWLPSGGNNKGPLGLDDVDPDGKTVKNSTANHALALTFNIRFNEEGLIPGGSPGNRLGDQLVGDLVTDGKFAAKTVQEVLDIANALLSGDDGPLTALSASPLDLLNVMDSLNNLP